MDDFDGIVERPLKANFAVSQAHKLWKNPKYPELIAGTCSVDIRGIENGHKHWPDDKTISDYELSQKYGTKLVFLVCRKCRCTYVPEGW